MQREPTPSPFRWPLGMPLSRTQKILQFMVSSGNCPVMPPPAQSIPSTYPSDNGWLLWKLFRPWGNDVGPQEVSKASSYLVPEQRSRHRQVFVVFCDVSASQPDGLIRQRLIISWSDANLDIETSRSYVVLRYLQHARSIHSLWGWDQWLQKLEESWSLPLKNS